MLNLRLFMLACGERGIRTPGGSHLNGFQDRRNRPLCHLSGGKSTKKIIRKLENNFFSFNLFIFGANLKKLL